MAKVTPSMAKNQIRRSLLQIIDAHPNKTQKKQIWSYFNSECAYCNIAIDINSRKGHLDHLLAVKDGGNNDIHNFVLACNICNGDEKREMPWRQFLLNKCQNLPNAIYIERLVKIEEWQQQSVINQLNDEVSAQIEDVIENAQADFDRSVAQMRVLRELITKN